MPYKPTYYNTLFIKMFMILSSPFKAYIRLQSLIKNHIKLKQFTSLVFHDLFACQILMSRKQHKTKTVHNLLACCFGFILFVLSS